MLSIFVNFVKKSEFCSCTTKTLIVVQPSLQRCTTMVYIVVQPQPYGRTTIGHSFCKEHIIRYKTDIFTTLQPSRLKISNLR